MKLMMRDGPSVCPMHMRIIAKALHIDIHVLRLFAMWWVINQKIGYG